MKPLLLTITLLTAGFSGGAFACADILKVSQQKLNSTESIDFCQAFEGKTLLVVNTASQCGFTPQYKQLEALYQKYKQQGLVVVGFPSNDFNQDRGGEDNTAKVCYLDYGVTFLWWREPQSRARMPILCLVRSPSSRVYHRAGIFISS
ncbi:glutathione peroxidase family protein [Vibrio sp. JCM 19236]|nr:glutathione peroxidase family protein [Vibrio sp. JCM 19236]